jgi:hypothetical protein
MGYQQDEFNFDLVQEVHEMERDRMAAIEAEQTRIWLSSPEAKSLARRGVFQRLAEVIGMAQVNSFSLNPLIFDMSHWNGTGHNWEELARNIQGVILKLGEVGDYDDFGTEYNDEHFRTNSTGAIDAGIATMAYVFDDGGAHAIWKKWPMSETGYPPMWQDPKMNLVLRQISYNHRWVDDPTVIGGKRVEVDGWRDVRAVFSDAERHWRYYAEYYKYLRREIDSYELLPREWVDFSNKLFLDRLGYLRGREMLGNVKRVGVYSRRSFITDYAPNMAATIQSRPEWLKWAAHYVISNGAVLTNFQDLRAKYYPPSGFVHKDLFAPSDFWQWSARYRFPEVENGTSTVDCNFAMMTQEQFNVMFGASTPPSPKDPTLDELRAQIVAVQAQVALVKSDVQSLGTRVANHSHDATLGKAKFE